MGRWTCFVCDPYVQVETTGDEQTDNSRRATHHARYHPNGCGGRGLTVDEYEQWRRRDEASRRQLRR